MTIVPVQVIEYRPMPDDYIEQRRQELLKRLKAQGFREDYVPSFNVEHNFDLVVEKVAFGTTDDDVRDIIWLCNHISRFHARCKDSCIDNYRLCRVGNEQEEAVYQNQKAHGCCGFLDRTLRNPKTGNVFKFGMNFGH